MVYGTENGKERKKKSITRSEKERKSLGKGDELNFNVH